MDQFDFCLYIQIILHMASLKARPYGHNCHDVGKAFRHPAGNRCRHKDKMNTATSHPIDPQAKHKLLPDAYIREIPSKVRHSPIITPIHFSAPSQRVVLWSPDFPCLGVSIPLKLWLYASPNVWM